MAINMDEVRKRTRDAYSRSKERDPGGGNRLRLTKKRTEMKLRVLPPVEQRTDNWFMEIGVHFMGSGKRGQDCPEVVGVHKCPLCERASQLLESENELDVQAGKDLRVKYRWLMWVVDRDSREPVAECFEAPKAIFDTLADNFLDEEIGDFTDIYQGFDYLVKREGAGLNTSYSANLRPNRCQLAATPEKINTVIGGVKPFMEMLELKSEQALNALLEGASDGEPKTPAAELVKGGAAAPAPVKPQITPTAAPAEQPATSLADKLRQKMAARKG